jgi:GTPase
MNATRAGYVALVGRPNVGKSTLLNAFLGEKLSIVTPRAQTTREPVTGIHTQDGVQIIFVDTPGLLEARYALQRSMHEQALGALGDADVVLLLLDAGRPDELPAGEALEALTARRDALIVAINKVDAAADGAVEALRGWSREHFGVAGIEVSALESRGIHQLREAIVERLPESPFFFPDDELATQSVRFFVGELVRETVFEQYEDEVPYSSVVRVDEYREGSDPLYIRATVYVERETQKAIIVGRQGSGIRQLGAASRQKIEAFLGTAVYLDLWVKAMPGWRRKASSLQYLGYRAPSSEAGAQPAPEAARPADGISQGRVADRRGRTKGGQGRGGRGKRH